MPPATVSFAEFETYIQPVTGSFSLAEHYNVERPHCGRALDIPIPSDVVPLDDDFPPILTDEIVGTQSLLGQHYDICDPQCASSNSGLYQRRDDENISNMIDDDEGRPEELLRKVIASTRRCDSGYRWERDKGLGDAFFLHRPFGSMRLSSLGEGDYSLLLLNSDGMIVLNRRWNRLMADGFDDELVKELYQVASVTTPKRVVDVDATLDNWLQDVDKYAGAD